jgi:flagellar basal-body rod modification protein FlgD
MMGVSSGTKNWGKTPDQHLPTDKSRKMAAGESPFGDKDIGTVLNEIADPNYVDASKVQRQHSGELDKDAFFKLMLTQMQNQDPMNPMQSHEMAAQLAQFTGLEQMVNMNSNLEAIKNGQNPMKDYQALSFIGKEVAADSSLLIRTKDDASHELRFTLGSDASEGKIKIKNEAGDVVRELAIHDLKKGKNTIRWDGNNENGQKTGEGEYKFAVEAETAAGKKVTVDTNTSGRITGIQFTKRGPLLLIGNQQVYLADVKKIVDPVAQAPATAEAAPAAAPASTAAAGAPPAPNPVPLAPQNSAKTLEGAKMLNTQQAHQLEQNAAPAKHSGPMPLNDEVTQRKPPGRTTVDSRLPADRASHRGVF